MKISTIDRRYLITKLFQTSSPQDLLEFLQRNIPILPRLMKDRTTKHTERWVSCHFLAAVSGSDLLEYPLEVEHRDKPDLVLSSRSERTGIEIIRAVPVNEARVAVYSERKGISCTRLVPPHRPGENKRSSREIEKDAKGDRRVLPYMGDWIEQNWINAMVYFAERKAKKFTLPGFEQYDKNWLLIHDDWSPAIPVNDDVTKPLSRRLFNCKWQNPFGKVFILESQHTVWEFSSSAEIVKHCNPKMLDDCALTFGQQIQ